MAGLATNKFHFASILSNNIWLNPTSLFVRHHVGYIPFEGLLHPWDTEEVRIHRQVGIVARHFIQGLALIEENNPAPSSTLKTSFRY